VKDPLETDERVETRSAAWVAALVAATLVLLVLVRPSLTVTIALIVGLILTVMLHEAGHMFVAKKSGMKVTEFFLGFGPRIWSFRRGETEYGIKAIPAGGYVRIIGMNSIEEVDPEDEARTYRAAPFPKRLATIMAGIAVNLLIAFVLIFVVLLRVGQPQGPNTTVSAVTAKAPAAIAGFEAGDRVLSIDGHQINTWDDVPRLVQRRAGESTSFIVERDGKQVALEATPKARSATDPNGFVGIAPGETRTSLGLFGSVRESVVTMWDGTVATGQGIARIFSPSGVERQVSDVTRAGPQPQAPAGVDVERPRSVIGIVSIGDQIVRGDIWTFLYLLATINLFLALFNMIPLLPFDGGHAAVACYEAVMSRVKGHAVHVDYRRLVPLTAAVLAVLLVFGVSTMFLDIREIITGS
jgi:membrane-associated protease RseP (regulator of RpoE activity)